MSGPAIDAATDAAIDAAVERADLDELVRLVDRLCGREEWDAIVVLRDRARAAVQRGKQLWPAASHAEYRLALEAPASWAGAVLVEGAGRFALGPLPEVAASTHEWADLAPHVPPGPQATMAAHERVVRGEDLGGDDRVDPFVLELPLCLAPWEPDYPVAVYKPDELRAPPPAMPATSRLGLPATGRRAGGEVASAAGVDALLALTQRWVVESEGRSRATAVRGGAPDAIAALAPGPVRAAELTAADAFAWMGWAAAAGGAHGRRRGAAAGRFDAWWVAATLAGLAGEWPIAPERLGEAVHGLRWLLWHPDEPLVGWHLHLAVEDGATGRAWALTATDRASPAPANVR